MYFPHGHVYPSIPLPTSRIIPSVSRRSTYVAGLCLAVLIGVLLRLHTVPQATYAGGVHPLDSDSAYHLRRARFAVERFPRTIQLDPLMNFPDGGVAIWPPLYDLALALPSRITHGAGATKEEVERGAAWIPVALAAGAIVLAGALGRRVLGPGSGAALALFVAVAPGHILWSQYAHTDQHVAESLCGLLALVAFLGSRARPRSAAEGQALREVGAGLALALAVMTWQGAIYWGAIFALSLVLESVAARRPVAGAAVRTLGVAAACSGAATLFFLGWVRPPVTYVSFGLFQPLFLAALAGGTAAVSTALRAIRGLATRREIAISAALAAGAAAVTLPFLPQLAAGLVRGVGYVAGTTSEVAGTGGYVSYPAGWLELIADESRKKRSSSDRSQAFAALAFRYASLGRTDDAQRYLADSSDDDAARVASRIVETCTPMVLKEWVQYTQRALHDSFEYWRVCDALRQRWPQLSRAQTLELCLAWLEAVTKRPQRTALLELIAFAPGLQQLGGVDIVNSVVSTL